MKSDYACAVRFRRGFLYGAEANVLFGRSRDSFRRPTIVDSTKFETATRATLGIGVGYLFRPHTIFSFDASVGLIKTNGHRAEDLTGIFLETEVGRSRFLSLHTAVQSDIWRNLFASASFLSLTQSRKSDDYFFPDRFGRVLNENGIFEPSGRTTDFYTDFYSNFGVGWRFKRNFVLQYTLTTNYGQTAPRHTFFLRYAFDFDEK